jgi:hypothetical protein
MKQEYFLILDGEKVERAFETLDAVNAELRRRVISTTPYYDYNYRYFLDIEENTVNIMKELKNSCTVYPQLFGAISYEIVCEQNA